MPFPNPTQLEALRVLDKAGTWVPGSNRTTSDPKPTVNSTSAGALTCHYQDPKRQLVEAWYRYDRLIVNGSPMVNNTGADQYRITDAGRAKLAKLLKK